MSAEHGIVTSFDMEAVFTGGRRRRLEAHVPVEKGKVRAIVPKHMEGSVFKMEKAVVPETFARQDVGRHVLASDTGDAFAQVIVDSRGRPRLLAHSSLSTLPLEDLTDARLISVRSDQLFFWGRNGCRGNVFLWNRKGSVEVLRLGERWIP